MGVGEARARARAIAGGGVAGAGLLGGDAVFGLLLFALEELGDGDFV